jgi:hypothetical protein
MREKVPEYNINLNQLNQLFRNVGLSSTIIFIILLALLWVQVFFKIYDFEISIFRLHVLIFIYIYISFIISNAYFRYSWKIILSNITNDIRRHYYGMLCDKEASAFLEYKKSGIFDEEYKYLEKELYSK